MNYVVTKCITPVGGMTRAVKTDHRDVKTSLAPNLDFKFGVGGSVTWQFVTEMNAS